ncbi:e3 ubiquitin-protein ligase aip2-like isoform 2 [Stylonychia lemnae]|uniref:E3 ubiquitin-protein ligase aip2-like isoform 2 n=1 Tax=Stylonychia lemnae TaxID=5949 RepID=A0A078BBT1_STYLE|nr:e3 ubiquitin-protein ligase aip2-like isoform 2 [Stylonychia lemnae]|eukprot:CDW91839.1 e3 ubiquitin-protein ligase aip2-like isoform 2 [Stylonychia lemnae]
MIHQSFLVTHERQYAKTSFQKKMFLLFSMNWRYYNYIKVNARCYNGMVLVVAIIYNTFNLYAIGNQYRSKQGQGLTISQQFYLISTLISLSFIVHIFLIYLIRFVILIITMLLMTPVVFIFNKISGKNYPYNGTERFDNIQQVQHHDGSGQQQRQDIQNNNINNAEIVNGVQIELVSIGSTSVIIENKKGVEEVVKRIPREINQMYIKDGYIEIQCAICCETIQSTKENFERDKRKAGLVELDCNSQHIFHNKCISAWLRTKNQCPLCRQKVLILLD